MSSVPVPDFGSLAQQQFGANTAATNMTNQANRPDQTNAMGSTTWSMNPDGTWANSSTMNAPTQNLFDTTMQGSTNLASTIGAGPDMSNLGTMPTAGQYVPGATAAWMALAQPQQDAQDAAARTRAAAMGITLGSDANNMVERNIGTNDSTMTNQGILQGYNQGNTEFTQSMQARQQAEKEAMDQYTGAVSGSSALTASRNSLDPNSWNTKVPTSAAYTPQQITGAAQDTFNALMQNQNSDNAQRNANITSGLNAVKALGGTSGLLGSGGLFGSGGLSGALSSGWNGLSSLWGGGAQGNALTADTATNVGTDYLSGSGMDALGLPNDE